MGIVEPRTESFLDAAIALTPQQLHAVSRALSAEGRPRLDAVKAVSKSAALFSTVDRRSKEQLRPMADEINALQPHLFPSVTSMVRVGAFAVQTPSALTPEQYRLLTGPFADAGVPVPPHPEESA